MVRPVAAETLDFNSRQALQRAIKRLDDRYSKKSIRREIYLSDLSIDFNDRETFYETLRGSELPPQICGKIVVEITGVRGGKEPQPHRSRGRWRLPELKELDFPSV